MTKVLYLSIILFTLSLMVTIVGFLLCQRNRKQSQKSVVVPDIEIVEVPNTKFVGSPKRFPSEADFGFLDGHTKVYCECGPDGHNIYDELEELYVEITEESLYIKPIDEDPDGLPDYETLNISMKPVVVVQDVNSDDKVPVSFENLTYNPSGSCE